MSHKAAKEQRAQDRELHALCAARCETQADANQLYIRLAPQLESMKPATRRTLLVQMRRAVDGIRASAEALATSDASTNGTTAAVAA